MANMRATFVTLSLVAATVVLSAQQNPFVGRWNLRGTGADTNKIYFLEVTQKDGKLEAIFLDRSAHATPVAWIRMEGNELVWQKGAGEGLLREDGHPRPDSRVRPDLSRAARGREAGRLTQHAAAAVRAESQRSRPRRGCASSERLQRPPPPPPPPSTIKWVGTRQPVWPTSNANGYHTYGKPVVLVGPGVGKEAWTRRYAGDLADRVREPVDL